MYFVNWLLQRLKRNLFGNGRWRWIGDYRNMIIREKPMSILVTIMGGIVFTLFAMLCVLFWFQTKTEFFNMFHIVICIPPAFWFYNWIMALYEIFDAERMATWEAVKTPYE
jgi:hypothetical protein